MQSQLQFKILIIIMSMVDFSINYNSSLLLFFPLIGGEQDNAAITQNDEKF